MKSQNSFDTYSILQIGPRQVSVFRIEVLSRRGFKVERLPFSMRILLENLLRNEDGRVVTAQDIQKLATWNPQQVPDQEIAFRPARVLLQDFTGVPVVVDLAAMRDAVIQQGGDPRRVNPLQPVELVIDHSVQVDVYGTPEALKANVELEFARNRERYIFLRWGQKSLANFKVVPPNTGIVHQVNLEYLARVVFENTDPDKPELATAYPDTLVGTDSHTTMINGLGVLGWGVGGIEAEAAMLGQPVTMLIPQVIGMRLSGRLPEGATSTDLVLTVTELLRKQNVVGMFVEFYGPGLSSLPLADRATIANMCPEYGATCGFFPVDEETLRYLRFTGRSQRQVDIVKTYLQAQGLFYTSETPEAEYSRLLTLDLGAIEPSLAGPKRPQDRVRLTEAKRSFYEAITTLVNTVPSEAPKKNANHVKGLQNWEAEGGHAQAASSPSTPQVAEPAWLATSEVSCSLIDQTVALRHGSVVIAAITSCTNTSNPSVMIAAGLLGKKAIERGLRTKPWVKTSLAPGSRVVTEYLQRSGLSSFLDQLGFHTVGYGCTTCIGNSGPLPPEISQAITKGNLVVCSVLSGNRNFEGRINPEVKANYLMSPPLVVAYAIAGRMDIDLYHEPIGEDLEGRPVFLRDIWPSRQEIQQLVEQAIQSEMFQKTYTHVFEGDERWRVLPIPEGDRFAWEASSTYIRRPPYFDHMPKSQVAHLEDIEGARVLALLGDSITTDHISPAGSIKPESPAGRYLVDHGVDPKNFNSYGSRRGNHEVMMRGTFANVRLRNRLAQGREGGFTAHLPSGELMTIFDAAMKYQAEGVLLVVLAGKEYGSGSSRDWAAKGPALLGVRVVIAESFERIHRSNLVGMGILPLQFQDGQSVENLQLSGRELFCVTDVSRALSQKSSGPRIVTVHAYPEHGSPIEFTARVRIDSPQEMLYYFHGGILPYVLRQLLTYT